MATYTNITIDQDTGIGSGKIDGVLFSSVNLANGFKTINAPKIAHPNSVFSPEGNQTDKTLIVNAVDIDWNGAEFPNTTPLAPSTINTTGDLINAIKWASAQGTTYNDATTSSAGLMSSGDKIKLESIDYNANDYTLPVATSGSLGGIKLGYIETGKKYAVKLSDDAAYVEVPWTEINANIDTQNKKLTVSDSNNSEKFKIELTTDTNNSDVAVIKISSGNTNIWTAVPGITIDGRKLVWTNASGVESNSSITFGNLTIKGVFSEDSDPETDDLVIGQSGNRYVALVDPENTEQINNSIKDDVNVGDLYLQQISGVYHLFVCDEVVVDEEAVTYEANAYFINLGVFPGNNITLSAENISLTDISSEATGVTTTDVQTALEHTLYYKVIGNIPDIEEEDNTNTGLQEDVD